MTELLTAAQMRAIEQAAIDSGEVTGLELMERAGAGVVEAILEEWPAMAFSPHKAVVLCGPGNNGGDGFVVARLLKERGWEVEVFLYGDEEKLPVDAKVNCLRWREMGEVCEMERSAIVSRGLYDLRVDAIFGSGLTRRLPQNAQSSLYASIYEVLRSSWPKEWVNSVAIDCPSGLESDSGSVFAKSNEWDGDLTRAMQTDITVTFHKSKVGHHLAHGASVCRKLYIIDIGLEICRKTFEDALQKLDHVHKIEKKSENRVKLVNRTEQNFQLFVAPWPSYRLGKSAAEHKFSHGHALILSGPSGKTGAARLAARGALRIGSGLVTVACPPDAVVENAAQLNAIMLNPVADATALNAVLQDKRINALCVGPALGLTEDKAALVREVLAVRPEDSPYGKRKIVLDADALTLLSRDAALFAMLHKDCVLTPHAGEFARLFPDIAAKLAEPATKGPAYSKVDATRDAAKRAGCVVLYKGADTVIASPNGQAAINSAHYERAAPWLATAGSGDVLAGFITGLLARGFPVMLAAETAAWLHVECAIKFGPGLIAEDLSEQLPKVFSDLGL